MKFVPTTAFSGPHLELIAASEKAARSIPPLWPLAATVAVNPYLGQTDLSLAQTAAQQARVAGARVTMEPSWYLERLSSGQINDADLAAPLAAGNFGDLKAPEDVRAALAEEVAAPAPLPTVADLAAAASGIDWPALIAERIGAWAAAYFDTGQALWQLAPGQGAYDNWKSFASRDLSPEIMGLKGFAARVNAAPDTAPDAMGRACEALGMSTQAAITYFQQLLAQMGGWAQLGRYKLWQAELAVSSDRTTTDLLVIALSFEAALLENYRDEIAARWQAVMDSHATPPAPTRHDLALVIAQEAAERAGQRDLAHLMAADTPAPSGERPALQAAFCIDVRSEVYRRALESVDPAIETKGFAGFFGLAVAHQDEGSDIVEKRLPVLLNPGVESAAAVAPKADTAHRISARASRAWGRFKLAAISSFAFVEATGPVYAGKLVKDALGQRKPAGETAAAPRLDPKMTMGDKIGAAKAILGAMSLTSGFAPLVMMVGHGASVTNNPHASALHCGACGGYKGDVNARLLAQLLNDPQVRAGLAEAGIEIPADTLFLGALHDTTTDEITTFADDLPGGADLSHLKKAKGWMAQATNLTKAERALRLPGALDDAAQVAQRSRDWSEVQPEWALAGCKAFIAAPRARTKGKSLAGRAFLHDYDWRQDDGFGVLELILTAPVVVASWISLQYYGSTVAPHVYGAGNKVLHNVTGGIGVLEGNGGNLRGGLPWQSVHDGTKLAHEPLRLSVCVEAPTDAINDILDRHPGVKDLFDNGWLHLFAMDDNGTLAQRYTGDLSWAAEPAPAKAA